MAAISVYKAVQNFFATLSFSGKPAELWFDGVNLRGQDGDPTELPTANILDGGTQPDDEFERHAEETTTITLEYRAATLEDATGIALGVRFGGSVPSAAAGLAWCQSLSIASATVKECRFLSSSASRETAASTTANVVHRIADVYRITVLRTG